MAMAAVIPMLITAVAGGVSAYGAIQEGKAARSQANYQAAEQEYQSKVAGINSKRQIEQAQAESDALARRRDRSLGAQIAAASASGLTISGSVIGGLDDSAMQAEEDMEMIMYRGRIGAWNYAEESRSLMGTAAATRVAGKNAYGAAKWRAAGTVLKTVGSMYSMGVGAGAGGAAGAAKGGGSFTTQAGWSTSGGYSPVKFGSLSRGTS